MKLTGTKVVGALRDDRLTTAQEQLEVVSNELTELRFTSADAARRCEALKMDVKEAREEAEDARRSASKREAEAARYMSDRALHASLLDGIALRLCLRKRQAE
eukprot:gene43693-25740_t